MNTSELIEHCESELAELTSLKELEMKTAIKNGHPEHIYSMSKELEIVQKTLDILICSSVRATKDNSPTRASADKDGFLLAKGEADNSLWAIVFWTQVKGDPAKYPYWTMLPQVTIRRKAN